MKKEIEDTLDILSSAPVSPTDQHQRVSSKVRWCVKKAFKTETDAPCGCDECRGETFIKDEPYDADEEAQQEEARQRVKNEDTKMENMNETVDRPVFARASKQQKKKKKASVGKRPFVCSHCEQQFARNSHLNQHLRTHTGERPFPCDQCPRRFAQKSNLNKHIQRVHSHERAISCHYCRYTCATKSDLILHARTHSDERPYRCDQCPSRFKTKSNLRRHCREIHSGRPMIPCSQCDRRYRTNSALKIHVRLVHSAGGPRFSCPQCAYQTNIKSYLTSHLANKHSDQRPFACDQCSLRFKQKSTLTLHIQHVHIRAQAYVCDECHFRCWRKGDLKCHARVHTDERPFACDQCSRRFKASGDLRKHARTVHNRERPFVCSHCVKRFKRNELLKRHVQRMHTDKEDKLNAQLESDQNQQQPLPEQTSNSSAEHSDVQLTTTRVKCIKKEEPEGPEEKKKAPCACDECRGKQFIKQDQDILMYEDAAVTQGMASGRSSAVPCWVLI